MLKHLIQRRSFFTIVQQGTVGMRLTLGSTPKELLPGIHLRLPLIHQVAKVDMRERSIPIDSLTAFTSDNVPVTINGSLFFQVGNAHDACFNVSDYVSNIQRIGTSAVRSIAGTFEYDQIIADRNKINLELQRVIGDGLQSWGTQCTRFEIQKFEPENDNIRRQLEQQMEAERSRRRQMLDTEAAVNVAEGIKRKTILESEGALQAQRNRAEGDYTAMVRRAEGHKAELTLEAEGVQTQLQRIIETVGDAQTAAHLLMELKRMEQFKAIADGKNNTIYFAKDPNLNGGYLADMMEKMKQGSGSNV